MPNAGKRPMANFLKIVSTYLLPPTPPTHILEIYRFRPLAAIISGAVAALVFLLFYYLTLGLLPAISRPGMSQYPVTAWEERLDLSQFFGTVFVPPWPTPTTWWIGLIVLGGLLMGLGVGYALLLSWALRRSTPKHGLAIGVILFMTMEVLAWSANGWHSAVMRNALPDTGFFLLGWTGWATAQILVCCLVYGAVLGALYRKLN